MNSAVFTYWIPPFNGRNVVWPPPAYANRHVFARNDKEIIRASLAAAPLK